MKFPRRRFLSLAASAAACAATALAACGVTPREDRSERSTLSRTYPVEMQSLASCALERLGKKYGKIEKTDFPDRYMVKLRRETDLVTLWDVDLIAAQRRFSKFTPERIQQIKALVARCDHWSHRGHTASDLLEAGL